MSRKALRTGLAVVIAVLAAALAVSAAVTATKDRQYAADEKTAEAVRDTVALPPYSVSEIIRTGTDVNKREAAEKESVGENPVTDMNLLRRIDFDTLRGINPDAERWLYIPDTNIDYYVMQEPREGEYYYLWRDIYGNESSWGSLFTPAQGEDDAHLLIFGHHMSTHDYAFAAITDYASEDFASQHRYVYVYYPDRAERWTVWCAEHVYGNDAVYDSPYIKDTSEYAELLEHIRSKAEVELTAPPQSDEDILVLSTCHRAWGGASGRFVVVCRTDETVYTKRH